MQLVVLILAVLVEVWFSIFRVQLQKERKVRRGKEAKGCPQSPSSSLASSPRCSQAFPSLTVCRDCGPRLKRLPIGLNLQVTAPSSDSS